MVGRKAIEWTPEQQKQFKDLCSIFCTREEICTVMGVSEKTLNRLVQKYFHDEVAPDRPRSEKITFDDAFEYYSATGRESLRRQMFSLAMNGDRQMLAILGKNYLGLTEKVEVTKHKSKKKEATPIDKLIAHASELGGLPASD